MWLDPCRLVRMSMVNDRVRAQLAAALVPGPADLAIAHEVIGEPFIGHVCLTPVDPKTLELGICVADDWQGWGIGRRLFDSAIAWARERGFETILASCFADNWRVLALLSSAPHPATIDAADGGVVDVVIPMHGPIPHEQSQPPYPMVRRRASVKPLRAAWRRTPPPVRVAGD